MDYLLGGLEEVLFVLETFGFFLTAFFGAVIGWNLGRVTWVMVKRYYSEGRWRDDE